MGRIMSLKDLVKTEKKIRWDDKRKTVVGFIIGIIILLELMAIALLKH